ncbi:hypothetical protein QUH73_18625 [Labilibaculum sp. K2S]|uniref:hypothetical protein n=1 Tax=Labilibaculum sp. K2S TaxID=3056386 RepID=UPI0025A44898|nr:hypothetical protein [Labilibaculum sp. K2S]MDM8161838.1 hypothetical protein [Labilibaculum sp. K2S]
MKKIVLFFCLISSLFTGGNLRANVCVLNGLSHIYDIQNKEIYTGVIELKNTGTKLQRLNAFTTDYTYNAKGESFYEQGNNERSNITWLELGANHVEIEPGDTYYLTFRISTPDEIRLPGSFWSVVMIEPVEDIDINSIDRNAGVGVRSMVRYAVQVICNNLKNAKSSLLFERAKLKKGNERLLYVDLINNGELYHKTLIKIEFYDPKSGELLLEKESAKQSIHPNNSRRFYVDISDIPSGKYTSVILAKCDDENVFGVNADFIIGGIN